MAYPYATEGKVAAVDLNRELRSVEDVLQNAGETINGETLPVPVYMDNSDDEWYACDANVQTKLEFRGFAISDGTDGNPITIQFTGVVPGFTGLTKGAKYYVQDTVGTIGTTMGTYEVYVGIAISTTEILIDHGAESGVQYCGTASHSGGSITVPAVARMAVVNVGVSDSGANPVWGQVTLFRKGGQSSQITHRVGSGASDYTVSISWSGSTISVSPSGTADTIAGATAYFYR